jgi:uncharacterized protein YdaL
MSDFIKIEMWLEITLTCLTVIEFLNMVRGYAVYFKEWIEQPQEEEMSESAKRMFS